MKCFKQFIQESVQNSIKVGDKIRVIRGNMMSGVVTKIDGNYVYFDHATSKYQTVWSGAKDQPKQYMAHISNVVKEDMNEAVSGPTRMDLQKQFDELIGSTNQKISTIEKSHNVKNIKLNSKGQIVNFDLNERCWDGYKPTSGKKPYEKGSCMKEGDGIQEDSEKDGKEVSLNKPFRTPDGPKKFAVYVKNDKGNVVKVTFGDPNMEIKRDSDDRRANFRARHNCDDPGPKDKARYWSCKMWDDTPVSKMTESVEIDISSAAKLFQRFLRSTGAPDRGTKLQPKTTSTNNSVFLGTSMNSKFDYVIDLSKRTVTATQPHTMGRPHSYVWDDKTGQVKMVEGFVIEAAPPDPEIEKWINDNKTRFKTEYGGKEGEKILYAKAWSMYNKK